ncbi:MAG TPA: MBL fold metallo-hydrolase, partial [Acidobacteriota bacterium]|nr:MBL fold metallo-hydrolase [Acidobacteriota bacterium]
IVDPFAVPHQEQGISLGLSLEVAGRRIVYSGDTGWTEELIARSADADLFICECSFYETRIPTHLDYPRLDQNRRRFSAQRMVLTHLGQEVLAHKGEIDMDLASDGLVIEL